MANSFHVAGNTVRATPGADVPAGEFLDGVGPGVGFADGAQTRVAGVEDDFLVTGVVKVNNEDDTAFAAWADVNYDTVAMKAVTTAPGGNVIAIGKAHRAYVAGEMYVYVALNGMLGVN